MPRLPLTSLALLALLATSACTGEIRITTTARASEEMLYVSSASERSVAQLDVTAYKGRRVFIDEQFLECVDKNYVVSCVRHQCMASGLKLAGSRESAELVLELRSGGVGTYARDLTIGIPAVLTQNSNETYDNPADIPTLASFGYSLREGWSHIQAFVYDRQTGRFLSGDRDNYGRSYKGFLFEDIYPVTKLEDLGAKVVDDLK